MQEFEVFQKEFVQEFENFIPEEEIQQFMEEAPIQLIEEFQENIIEQLEEENINVQENENEVPEMRIHSLKRTLNRKWKNSTMCRKNL